MSKTKLYFLGGTLGYIFSKPFGYLETPLAKRVKQYESIKDAKYVLNE